MARPAAAAWPAFLFLYVPPAFIDIKRHVKPNGFLTNEYIPQDLFLFEHVKRQKGVCLRSFLFPATVGSNEAQHLQARTELPWIRVFHSPDRNS